MPLGRRVARLNKVGLNRLSRHVAPHVPGFGVVEHRGRRSGRVYRTPINLFRTPDGVVIALPYGADADWVRNVIAAGGCTVIARGRTLHLANPRVYHDGLRRGMPPLVKRVLGWTRVSEFLALDRATVDMTAT